MKNVIGDFKKFVNKGNVFDLAIGLIIGTTFTAIVTSLVNDIIMPLVSTAINFDLTGGKVMLRPEVIDVVDGEEIVVKKAITLNWGIFLQTVINFLIIAIAIFVAVKTVKAIKNSYVRSQIRYLKKMRIKHPTWFDEDTDLGTKLYEQMKKDHPEQFKNEIADGIEERKKEAQANISPQELTNQLLLRLNENLEKMNGSQDEKASMSDLKQLSKNTQM